MSTLQFSLNETKELSDLIENKLSILEKENSALNATVKSKNTLCINLQKQLKDREESIKNKASEVQILKKERADEIKNLKEQHSREIEDLKNDCKID